MVTVYRFCVNFDTAISVYGILQALEARIYHEKFVSAISDRFVKRKHQLVSSLYQKLFYIYMKKISCIGMTMVNASCQWKDSKSLLIKSLSVILLLYQKPNTKFHIKGVYNFYFYIYKIPLHAIFSGLCDRSCVYNATINIATVLC